MTSKDENDSWRYTPAYDYEARRERGEAHCRTQQYGRHIETLPLEPKQPPLAYPLAFPKLKIYGGKPCVGGDALSVPLAVGASLLWVRG